MALGEGSASGLCTAGLLAESSESREEHKAPLLTPLTDITLIPSEGGAHDLIDSDHSSRGSSPLSLWSLGFQWEFGGDTGFGA